jgi:hypothetical protein
VRLGQPTSGRSRGPRDLVIQATASSTVVSDAERSPWRNAATSVTARRAVCWGRGYLNYYFGNFPKSGELAQAAIEAGVAGDDPVASGRAMDLGAHFLPLGDPLGTVAVLEDALTLARAAQDRWGEIDILQKIAFSYLYADRYDAAERAFDAARDLGLCLSAPIGCPGSRRGAWYRMRVSARARTGRTRWRCWNNRP